MVILLGIPMKKFNIPHFTGKSLELRFENGEVCIYGTKDGLRTLSALCAQLADTSRDEMPEHIHLQDLEILTEDSMPGVVAVFNPD